MEQLHVLSDESLMKMIQKGDCQACEIIYKRYSQKMLRFFYRMLNQNEESAQDFLQELFLKLIAKRHYYNPGKKFSTWLYTLATNLCKNEYRRLGNRQKALQYYHENKVSSTELNRDEEVDNGIIKNLIWEEISGLNQNHRAVLILRYQQDLPIKDIARIVKCSEGTVKSRLFYAIKKISERMNERNIE